MNIKIRLVNQGECAELTELGRSTFMASFGDQNDPSDMEEYLSINFSFEKIASELANPNSEFYFVESNQRVIGYLKVNIGDAQTEDIEHALEIERIYVIPDFQGMNIGQKLMHKVNQIATSKDISTVWLGVWDQNKAAIRFYERHGFQIFDSHQFMLGQDEQTDILMKKTL